MSYHIKTRDEHYTSPGPKRILTIDGGGLRGVFSLQLLRRIEEILTQRHGDGFVLGHYFDLIGGTSTGSYVASCLAMGMTVDEIEERYMDLGHRVFKSSLFRMGVFRAKYDKREIAQVFKDTFGEGTVMGDEKIQTGLMVTTKRKDTGSPWPIVNNPAAKYFSAEEGANYIANKDYPLWNVVRASTAAPVFFAGETIEIASQPGKPPVVGKFVDGGVSPYNNPSLQAFMMATLKGYRVCWPTGKDKLMLVAVGTGAKDPASRSKPNVGFAAVKKLLSKVEASSAVTSMLGMMDDCNALSETLLQWMSDSPVAKVIDSEIGDLAGDTLGAEPLLTYMRYNAELSGPGVKREIGKDLTPEEAKQIASMDKPENMNKLAEIGTELAHKIVQPEHFPAGFDLTAEPMGDQNNS